MATVLISPIIMAQEKAVIKGTIKDAKTNEPLFGVNIYTNTNQGTTTDFDGNFTLKLDPGTYEIKISFVSYKDIKKTLTLEAGQTITLNEKMETQTVELGITVVSASKYEKKLSEETVSMDVLGAQLIQNSNVLIADEAMEKVPGVTVVDGQANIRGGSGWSYGAGSRVAVLVDDLPFMSADAADAKWGSMAVEHVEQIEVIKGAASALYGSSALNGIINFRTAWPKSEPITKITMSTGISQNPKYKSLSDTIGEGVWYGREFPKTTTVQISHRRKIKSFDLIIGGNYNTFRGNLLGDYRDEFRVSGKVRYRPKNLRGFSTGVNYTVNNGLGSTFFIWNGLDSLAYTPFPNTLSQYHSLRVNIDPYIIYFDKRDNQYSFRSRYFNAMNTNNTGQGSVPQMYMADFQFQRMFVPKKLNIIAGVFGSYSWVRPPKKGSEGSLFGSKTADNQALYFQADKKFFDKLSVAAGVRYEFFRVEDLKGNSKPLFRFGVNYQAAEATYIRGSWGQGYRFPTIAEKFINTNVGIVGIYPNPKVEPESGWSAELGIKQGVKLGEWYGYLDLSGFINQYKNMMEFTFGPFGNPPRLFDPIRNDPNFPQGDPLFGLGFSSQNVGNTRIVGGEFTIIGTGKLGGRIPMNILAGYTYIDPRNLNWNKPLALYDKYGNQVNKVIDSTSFFTEFVAKDYSETSSSKRNVLKYRNRHTLKADIEWIFFKEKVGIGLSVQYTSFMENIDRVFVDRFVYYEEIGLLGSTNAFSALKIFREKNERGNTMFDARISYRFTPKAKLTFICKNILNQQIMERPAFLGPSRNYNLQFDIEF
jgi:iron complex outermembrane receptor protein